MYLEAGRKSLLNLNTSEGEIYVYQENDGRLGL